MPEQLPDSPTLPEPPPKLPSRSFQPSPIPLWDMAGTEALEIARLLWGDGVIRLGPWQSWETLLEGQPCSVLRLGDRSFRCACHLPLDRLIPPLRHSTWLRQLPWLASLAVSLELLPRLQTEAIVRSPHRLADLPEHRAVPALLQGLPLLIWRHPHPNQTGLELQMAQQDIDRLSQRLKTWHFARPND
jgi:hypothetical protein